MIKFIKVMFVPVALSFTACDGSDVTTYHQNGHVSMQYHLRRGVIDGECLRYYPDGNLRERRYYLSGEISGKFSQYNPEGMLTFESEYVKGKKDGLTTLYYGNGKVKSITPYSAGIRIGEERMFDMQGSCTHRNRYDSAGNLIYGYAISNGVVTRRLYPLVKITSHKADVGKYCKLDCSFAFPVSGDVAVTYLKLDSLATPVMKVQRDSLRNLFHVKLLFGEVGLHTFQLNFNHEPAGDTLNATGSTKDIRITVTDEHAVNL